MKADALRALADRLGSDPAVGSDLDAAIAEAFAVPPAHYSTSIKDCRALAAAALPDWKLHLGFGATGLFPYAAFTRDELHVEAEATAVPLAILKAAVAAASVQ